MRTLLAVAVLLMLGGAALLLADVGGSDLWIAVIAVGIALVVVARPHRGRPIHR